MLFLGRASGFSLAYPRAIKLSFGPIPKAISVKISIEEETAIVELENGEMLAIPAILVQNAKEGDAITLHRLYNRGSN